MEKTIRIAVCDDDPDIVDKMRLWLPSIEICCSYDKTVDCFSSGCDLIDSYRLGCSYDIIFLDVVMPGADGIQVARQIREIDEKVLIVFLTSSPDFAVQSYRVDAFDYILKSKFSEQMDSVFLKAVECVSARESECIAIRTSSGIHSVKCSDIEYFEIYAKKLSCRLVQNTVLKTYIPIRDIEADLAGMYQFMKIHRSIIVNLGNIAQINPKFVVTISGQRLPVARGKYPELEKAFLVYTTRSK